MVWAKRAYRSQELSPDNLITVMNTEYPMDVKELYQKRLMRHDNMKNATIINIKQDGWIRIEPSILKNAGIRHGKAVCIFGDAELSIIPLQKNSTHWISNLLKKYPAKRKISLEDVQQVLSGIKGSLSEVIIENRNERF